MKYVITVIGLIGLLVIIGFAVNRNSDTFLSDDEVVTETQYNHDTASNLTQETPALGNGGDVPEMVVENNQDTGAVIKMTSRGFEPRDVEIKLGESVTFENTGDKGVWPASNAHPIHDVYPEFDPKKIVAPGESWTFTFERVGAWKYHDHTAPFNSGTITVTE